MLVWMWWLGCGGSEEACTAPGEVSIDVTVRDQPGEPVLGARVELDRAPCVEVGEGLYRCVTAAGGIHDLFVLGGMQYAAFAQKIDVGELGCDPSALPVDVTLLPAMALRDQGAGDGTITTLTMR